MHLGTGGARSKQGNIAAAGIAFNTWKYNCIAMITRIPAHLKGTGYNKQHAAGGHTQEGRQALGLGRPQASASSLGLCSTGGSIVVSILGHLPPDPCIMSMHHVHASCPCIMSMHHVHASCLWIGKRRCGGGRRARECSARGRRRGSGRVGVPRDGGTGCVCAGRVRVVTHQVRCDPVQRLCRPASCKHAVWLPGHPRRGVRETRETRETRERGEREERRETRESRETR